MATCDAAGTASCLALRTYPSPHPQPRSVVAGGGRFGPMTPIPARSCHGECPAPSARERVRDDGHSPLLTRHG